MNCRICLKEVTGSTKHEHYHDRCVKMLFGSVKVKPALPFTRAEFFQRAPKKTKGFSISGVQTKAQLDHENNELTLVDRDGRYILKPSPHEYPYAAENEHLSMLFCQHLKIEIPPCGLIPFQDGELAYVVMRYDRDAKGERIHQEDGMQILGFRNDSSASKYESATYSEILRRFSEISRYIAMELFKRIVAAYAIGNEDFHLKNISILHTNPIKMTPSYDNLNTLIHITSDTPMALKFYPNKEPSYFAEMGNGYYSGGDFIELAVNSGLPKALATKIVNDTIERCHAGLALIERSPLPDDIKRQYQHVIRERLGFLGVH